MKTFKYRLITYKDESGKVFYRVKSKYLLFWCYLHFYDDWDCPIADYEVREQAIQNINLNAKNRRAKIYRIELIEEINA